MRWNVIALLAAAFVGIAVASPIQEDSSIAVAIAEASACDGSHYIVSVQRTDDVKEDSGELIAERVSNIVFDFKVDREAENLLINGYALKLIPQSIQKMTFFAAVIPSDHPTLPGAEPGSITSPHLIEALHKLESTGLITADVDLSIAYEGDVRTILVHVQVLELEGCAVNNKDLLTVKLAVPGIEGGNGPHHHPRPQEKTCESRDWICRISNWFRSLVKPHRCAGGKGRHPDWKDEEGYHNHGGYHRHRFHPPRRGFMRFIIQVVIPVVIGGAAGLGIGIVSVFIVEIVGGVIMRIRGRRAAEYCEVVDKDDEVFEEALPAYEEGEMVPTYTAEKQ